MSLPYKISTLLYAFNSEGKVLLLLRKKEPNLGLWSPFGGKLKMEEGESPYMCACREAEEEIGIKLSPSDLHLTGIVSEHGYEGASHWLMFLFRIIPPIDRIPPANNEGEFAFFSRDELENLPLPQTDREMIWNLFWEHQWGFFSAHCHCCEGGKNIWTIEESIKDASALSLLEKQRLAVSRLAELRDKDNDKAVFQNPSGENEPVIDLNSHHYFMGEALRQAVKAAEMEEVPVGAVIVRKGKIIARAHNQVELLKDGTAHAEMLALTQAQAAVGDWRLTDCTLYVTKEPCPMCAGAMVNTRISTVVYGAPDPKYGAAGSALNILQFPSLNHRCSVISGVRLEECRALLKSFFLDKR
jgi:tRNA(Arg) A34 adenosine deaminase TadA/ADP-ribose pyrophosphatase YjhB (NUDIX family)